MRGASWRASVLAVSFGLGLFLIDGVARADSWPGFRGPNRDGRVTGALVLDGGSGSLSLGWKRALGSGYSALAVGDGRVLAMFADDDGGDYLAAYDTNTGDERWRYRIADTYRGHDGSHDGPISTPLLAGGRVYGLGAWGHLFAVEAATGKEVWKTHLAEDHGFQKPYFGFTTSPLMADGVLVIEATPISEEEETEEGEDGDGSDADAADAGGEKADDEADEAPKMALAGFDPDTGKLRWRAGDDVIEYHSPIVASVGGRRQVVAAGKSHIYGIEPGSGTVLWSYEHAGDERAMGGFTIVPVPAGDDRIFVMNKIDSSTMLRVTRNGAEYTIEELWSSPSIKQSYVVPVYHEGYVYGMSNRIFTCMDAATGEIQWRSREPGDGFPILVGDQLVIMTKAGSLHVARSTPAGYEELARLDLFEDNSWSEVAYVDGHLFARSMGYLARVDPVGQAVAQGNAVADSGRDSIFAGFLAEVATASDPAATVDAFLARQSSFPIIENDGRVHFLYRGDAADVGIVGDMIGFRREDPMQRIPGTDLFYYTTRLEPDAAVAYGFIVDYGDAIADPLNPVVSSSLFGEMSFVSMPARRPPAFVEFVAARPGRLDIVEWESAVLEGKQRMAKVYLPAGYDGSGERRYPTLYVQHGKGALETGRLEEALDYLIETEAIEPVIGVFVFADEENARGELRDMDNWPKMLATELVPRIDADYRTIREPLARATVGSGLAAPVALVAGFKHPEIFGRVGAQSSRMDAETLIEMTPGPDELPMVIYLEWGTYHMRSPHEAWDLAEENRRFWSHLRQAGYRPAGGEVPEGYGWPCWSGHTEDLLVALFPQRAS